MRYQWLLIFCTNTSASPLPTETVTAIDDTNTLVAGGNMESADGWQITDFSSNSSTRYSFGDTTNCPTAGEGGCLRIQQGSSFGQFLVWQRVTLTAGELYRISAAIRLADYQFGSTSSGGVWYQLYLYPDEVAPCANDYDPNSLKLLNIDSWKEDFQAPFDGLWQDLNLGGGMIEAPFYRASGEAGEEIQVTLGLKFGHSWAGSAETSFDITVDEVMLTPVAASTDISQIIQENVETIAVDINFNVQHSVGGISEFDRSKYINIHASHTEPEWDSPEQMDEFLNGLDVYLGRDVGAPILNLQRVNEDPERLGYPDVEQMQALGDSVLLSYNSQTYLHQYEARNDLIISTHVHPFFPDGTLTNQGWAFADSAATAEFMAHYIHNYYGDVDDIHGQPMPIYYEIMNEPVYELVVNERTAFTTEDIFAYHNVVAERVRELNPDINIGGYTAAYTNFETNNFQEWETHWQLFIDMAGQNMDFFSLHFYDFPFAGGQWLKTGSNAEAVMDMLEYYSYLSYGEVTPMFISEYGGFDGDFYNQPWSSERDWLNLKSHNALLLQFMERPDNIIKTIPFIVLKGIWGARDYPYPWTLMREEDGQWVYTDILKLYELWADVSGTRVDTYATDPDIQIDAYVDGNTAYVILNNLDFEARQINLNTFGNDAAVESLTVRHLSLVDDTTILDITEQDTDLTDISIDAEATMILVYTFADPVDINQGIVETKYYADEYLQPILANTSNTFYINDLQLAEDGEAILRLGLGRDHGDSLQPTILFNGTEISVPRDYRGYNQRPRPRFFGVLEIPIPYELLQENNTISIHFDDSGGHISSLSMQVFNATDTIVRTELSSP